MWPEWYYLWVVDLRPHKRWMLVVPHIYLLNHECLVHLSPSFPFYLVWNMYALLVFISLQHSSNAIFISNTQFHLVSFLFLKSYFL